MPCSPSVLQQYGNILTVASISVAPTGSDRYPGRRIFTADTFREYLWDGTGWIIMSEPAQTGNFSFTGITGGSPTIVDSYHRSDGWIEFRATDTLAGTPSAIASMALTSGIALTGVRDGQWNVTFGDASFLPCPGGHAGGTASSFLLHAWNASSTSVAYTPPTLTVPFTFATGDNIQVAGRAQMTSRYS